MPTRGRSASAPTTCWSCPSPSRPPSSPAPCNRLWARGNAPPLRRRPEAALAQADPVEEQLAARDDHQGVDDRVKALDRHALDQPDPEQAGGDGEREQSGGGGEIVATELAQGDIGR